MILFALNRTLCLLGPSQIALVGDIVIVDNQQCTCFGSMCMDSASTFSGLFSVAGTCQSTTLHIKLHASLMDLQSISKALPCTDTLHIRLCILCNSALPPASAPLHVLPLLVCLFVCLPLLLVHMLFVCLSISPSRLFLLIDGQWTDAKSDCTHSIRRGLGRRLRSSLLLNSSPSTSRDHPLVA